MVLYGASTGRDGIGGVSVLASATLEDGAEGSRPSVQIGDPFAGKLLIEASLELVGGGCLEGLQDLGGAGITCAVSESAARAGMGASLDLDAVPLREAGMVPFEILTSESQERMLAIVHPSKLDEVQAVCDRWGLTTAVIGELIPGGTLSVRSGGAIVAEVPASSLADDGPVYDRPAEHPARSMGNREDPTFVPFEKDLTEAVLTVLTAPNVASKRWAFEQYDRVVQGNTVAGPDSDAAVVRVAGTLKGLALSTDSKSRFGRLDPFLGQVTESDQMTVVVTQQAARLSELLAEQGVQAVPQEVAHDPPRFWRVSSRNLHCGSSVSNPITNPVCWDAEAANAPVGAIRVRL